MDWQLLQEKINSVKASNKSLLYNTMLYWSQKPFNITNILIENLSSEGDIIFDPFMGSGVTLLEATNHKLNRRAIGVDINDMPIFLCKNSVTIPTEKTYKIIDDIKTELSNHNYIYDTNCVECGNQHARISKIIYDIEPELIIKEIHYSCNCSSKKHIKNATTTDYNNFIHKYNIKHISDLPLIANSRIAVKDGETISDKFSKRSFYALDIIKGLIMSIEEPDTKNILWYIYASIIHKTKILDIKLSSQWPLWIPKKNCVERNVFEIFINNIDKYIKSREYVSMLYNADFVDNYQDLTIGKSLIIKKGIQNISEAEIPSSCVDLIITDPPYLGQVPYSEYMQLYRPFLDNKINFEDEIVITNAKNREKSYSEYFSLMKIAFKNISRILKPNGYICLYFHDSDLKVWYHLIETFENAGLSFETCMHINKSQKTLKKILDPKKTMSGETLLFLTKKAVTTKSRKFTNSDLEKIQLIAEDIIKHSLYGYATTSQLYDNGILNFIIEEGILFDLSEKYKDLTDIFSQILIYNSDKGVWEINKSK